MRKINYALGLMLTVASFSAAAASLIRVKCDAADAGAHVFANGELKGGCPVDVSVEAGAVQIRVQRINGDYGQFFEKMLLVVDGVPQRVDVTLSASRLTAEGKRRQEVEEAERQLKAAESGDVDAMDIIAGYYAIGLGVEKDSEKAAAWRAKRTVAREKVAATELESAKVRAAAGEVSAMQELAARYESGIGVARDMAQAREWRAKAEVAEREERMRQEQVVREAREHNRQLRVASIEFFQETKSGIKLLGPESDVPSRIVFTAISPIVLPVSAMVDLTHGPGNSTKVVKIRSEAAMHPSAWGNPNSMVARALQRSVPGGRGSGGAVALTH